MTMQILYIDKQGGVFISWYYSEGNKYPGRKSSDLGSIKKWAKDQGFNKVVIL